MPRLLPNKFPMVTRSMLELPGVRCHTAMESMGQPTKTADQPDVMELMDLETDPLELEGATRTTLIAFPLTALIPLLEDPTEPLEIKSTKMDFQILSTSKSMMTRRVTSPSPRRSLIFPLPPDPSIDQPSTDKCDVNYPTSNYSI